MTKISRFLFLAIITLVSSIQCLAQESVTFLDWDIIAKDTLCPVYSEVVPLESDYRTHEYSVKLEYPTWEKLSKRELSLAHRYSHEIKDSINLHHYISVSRGNGLLNYHFIPIIYKNNQFLKLTSAIVRIIAHPHSSAQARTRSNSNKRYADNSVLSNGFWKKIHITHDGMYSLSPTFLKNLGFNNPDNVHLYGYGGHQQEEIIDADNDFDDLQEVPLFKAPNGNLLFWGNGLVYWKGAERIFNAYARQATYFLTEGGKRQDIQTEEEYNGNIQQTVSTTLGHAIHEVDNYAWFRGGRNLVEEDLYSGAQSRTYTLTGINSVGNEKLTVVFTGNVVATPLTIWANGGNVATKTIPAPSAYMYYSEGKYANMNVREHNAGSTWKITLATQGPFDTDSRVQGRLDYIALNYTQPLELQQGFIFFGDGYEGTGNGTGSANNVTKMFSGATCFTSIKSNSAQDIKVMRLGERFRPATLIQTKKQNNEYSINVDDGTDRFVAFDPNYAFPEPVVGETVDNQNLHSMQPVDMVIIVPTSGILTAQAHRLAEAHSMYSNMKCAVVKADHIYNEFSSGTPDATAYRRFLKMLYDRGIENHNAPRYLLLMGDCAWDNRMMSQAWLSRSANDYLLCNQSENSYSDTHSYCWEDYFGLMDDGEGGNPTRDVSDLGIGRFPVVTEAQAKIMVDKTIAHLSKINNAEWCNRVVILGDDGDNNIHMTDANRVAETIMEANPHVDLYKLMWDNYVRENQGLYYSYPEIRKKLDKHVENGALMFNYTGHGGPQLMSHERVITLDDMRNWKSAHLPLWYVSACDITPFDSNEDNLGETAVLNEGGGAVAFIGSTRTVYSTQNFYLNNFFSKYLFQSDQFGEAYSVGDALRKAKESMVSNQVDGMQAQNKLQYALLGDPSLKFGNTSATIVLDSINGEAINGEQEISGGSRLRFSGHVEHPNAHTFNGMLHFKLYDSKQRITTKGNSGDSPFTYTDWNLEISQGRDTVVNGHFSTTVIIPKDISYSNENGRFVFYAADKEQNIEGKGSCEELLIGSFSNEHFSDSIGPDIYIYLNDKDFCDGDAVSNKPIFIAELVDESGIQYSGNGIGHDLQLCIDGDSKNTFNLNEFYSPTIGDPQRGHVYFDDMPELEEGAHWLSFRAWDLMNNTTIKTLKFIIGQNLNPEILSLLLESDIITGHTNFHIGYNYPGLECQFTLEIFSTNGALQWKQELYTNGENGILTIPWQGCNSAGAKINDGIYICRVTVAHDGSRKSHKEKKFILRHNK